MKLSMHQNKYMFMPGVKLNLYQLKPKELELWVSEDAHAMAHRTSEQSMCKSTTIITSKNSA